MKVEKSNKLTKDQSKLIKKKLIDLEYTHSDLAKEVGVSQKALSCTINGTTSSLRIRNFLAKRLDLPELRIIPDYLYLD